MLALTVTQPFADYSVGQTITDRAAIEAALASNPASVVRVNVEEPGKAEAKVEAPDGPPVPQPKRSGGSA